MGAFDDFKNKMKEAYEEGKERGKKAGSFEYQKEQVIEKQKIRAEKRLEKQEEKQYQKDRIKQLKKDHVPYCPKCNSTNITFINKKLSLGRAVTGGVLFGETGAILGGLSSKSGKVKCLNCGHDWKI